MPCRDYYDDHPQEYYGAKLSSAEDEIEKLKKQISFAESALCAALKAMESMERGMSTGGAIDIFRWFDFKDAGITKKQLVAWQNKHRALDEKHRRLEKERLEAKRLADEEKKREEKLIASARSKLTQEELTAIASALRKEKVVESARSKLSQEELTAIASVLKRTRGN